MNKTKITIFAGVVIVIAAALVFTMRNNSTSTKDGQGTIGLRPTVAPGGVVGEINPITNLASIPASVDPSTIRFEKLKTVELASKTKTTSNDPGCKDKQFRDPDGSGCQAVAVLEKVKAVEASYSYVGPEISTGEAIPGRQTFSVYFRPEEMGTDGPADKLKRDEAAALFEVHTFRPMVEQKVVDKQNSRFCEGKYVDGNFVKNDSNCQDQLQVVSQTAPSANWTVEVDLRHPATVATR